MDTIEIKGDVYVLHPLPSLYGCPVILVGANVFLRDSGDAETNRRIAIVAIEKVRAASE